MPLPQERPDGLDYLQTISSVLVCHPSDHTIALRGRAQSQSYKLQLVNLVGESEDEGLVEGQSLRGTLSVVEELYQPIRQLMPQFLLPQVFEVKKQVL